MYYTDLTKLIENIEDNLIKHIFDIQSLMKAGNITKIVLTPVNKSYPSTVTQEDIENDKDNIVVPIVPQRIQLPENVVWILSKERREDLLSKMQIGLNTIKDIKNNIISLGYTNKQVKVDITNERLRSKIPTLTTLEYAITQSKIANQEIKNSSDELLCMIKKLVNEIEKVNSNPNEINEHSKENEIMKNNDTEALKHAREYTKYISHNEIIELVKQINKNETDAGFIKKMLTDCLNQQFQKLPIQNDTLKTEVFNTFCLMVKNTETRIFTYGIISSSYSLKSANNFHKN